MISGGVGEISGCAGRTGRVRASGNLGEGHAGIRQVGERLGERIGAVCNGGGGVGKIVVLHDDHTVSLGCDINRADPPRGAALELRRCDIAWSVASGDIASNEERVWNSDDTEMPNPSRLGIW